jgi:hypothetical protein
MGKKSPAPPPAPDYAGAAQQQGIANLEAARLTARLSNPNVITPLGGQRVTYGRPQFNRAAYDAAMADWRSRQPQTPTAAAPQTVGIGGGAMQPGGGSQRMEMGGGMYGGGVDLGVSPEPMASKTDGMPAARREALEMGDDRAYTQGGRTDFTTLPTGAQVPTAMLIGGGRFDASGMGPGAARFQNYGGGEYMGDVMPTREMFTEMVDLDTPTIEQYLTPEAEATLKAQQRVERALSGLGEKAIENVQKVYGTDFTPQGLPAQQFQFGGYGNLPTLPELQGQARADVSALPVNFGPTAGQYGFAGGGPAGVQFGGLDTSGLAPVQTGVGQFGTAQGGPAAGTLQGLNLSGVGGAQVNVTPGQFGMAQGGPSGISASSFDASGLGMAGGGPGGGAFGAAQGGVGAPSLRGQYDLTGVGDVARAPGAAAAMQSGPTAPTLQGQLDTSRLAAMPVNAGMTAQQAIMSRLDPQLQRQRAQLETQLANQGLVRGGEAYGAAITEQQQQENDLRTQAALQGLSLDMAARQQGLGEAQALGGFANQAALAGFGAGQQATAAQNAAAQQNFQNELARQAAANQAQQQAFGQRAQAGQFGNEAQLAAFQEAMQNQAAGNQAIGQNFGQAQAAQAMANQAQAQNFQQRMAAGEFGRQGQLMAFQTGQQAQQAQNAAMAQNFGQAMAVDEAARAAQAQRFGQAVTGTQVGAALAGQQFEMGQQAQQAQNAAIAQNAQIALQSGQFANAAQAQQFAQRLAAGEFGRDAQMASFQTGQAAQEAVNRAIAQNFQQGIGAAGAYNTAAAQQFGQNMDIAGLYNATIAQNQQAALQQAQAQAALQAQGFNQAQAAANFQNAQRQAALQEQLALRALPLNEVAAIMGGAQVQMPQFQAYQGAEVGAAPIFGATQAAGNFAQQNYQNQIARQNAQMGLYGSVLGGLGGGIGQAGSVSKFFG